MAAVLFSLAACWGLPWESRSPGGEQALQSNLSVASAALAAGQPAVAQRLYFALAERFADAPEPGLGLGYVALRGNNPGEARRHFLRAASLADDAPGMKAEALLGAARASLAEGDSRAARRHLTVARDLARDPSSIAWIENGLAVAAVFEEDYATAEAHYVSALHQPSAHPRIAANFVRMLVASERVDEAERTFGAYAASWWEENDRQALQSLIDEARRSPPVPRHLDPRLVLRLPESVPLSARLDERSGSGVRPAAYGPDAVYGPDAASPGLVLLVGSRSIPLAGPGRTGGPDPVQADRLSPERATQEAADPAPVAPGTSPESQRPIQVPEPALERRPSLRTAGSEADRSASRASSVPPASRDILTLRIGPRRATSGLTPDAVEEAAADSRFAPSADADMGRSGIALLETGGRGLRLLPAAGSSLARDWSGIAEPQPGAAPAAVERTVEAEAAPAAGSGAPVAGGEVWAHYLGPDPAQSANELVLTAMSRHDSLPGSASSRLPSSPVSLGPRLGAAPATHAVAMAATPETGPHFDATQTSQPRLPRTEYGARLGLSEPVPARAVNVAVLDDHRNYDPFSDAPDTFRPILLASASPHLDDFLWQPEWMRPAAGTNVGHTTSVAVDGGSDSLAQAAEAGTGAPAPGGKWAVLLGTGQRLSLEVAAAAVAVASPEIADVQLLSPRVLFVMGRNLGRTTVSVLGEDGSVFERDVTVVLDLEPLRELLAGEPGLEGVRVDSLARGVALAGDVDSQEAADRALGLASASLPEGLLVENNLIVGLDLLPFRTLLAGESGLESVEVRRVGRGVALTGEVASAEAADRAYRLGAASLPAGLTVENNLRVVFDIEPLRSVLAAEPGLEEVQVQRLARGVFLAGSVDSPAAAERALRLATASLPDGLLVESSLNVELDLSPLRAALAGEPGLHRVQARRLARGVALTGEVDSPELADRAFRMAAASLPEGIPVENNLNLQLDLSPLRTFIAGEPGLGSVEVRRDGGGVALTGEVASTEAADRAQRLAAASLPEGAQVENRLRVAFDIAPLRAALAGESGLGRVHVQRLARSVVLSGDVDSPEAESRALRLAAASLPEGVPVENDLNVGPALGSLRALLAGEPGLAGVGVQRIGRGVALTGDVAWVEAAERASRLAAMSLPESVTVENNLRVVFDLEPLLAVLAAEPGLEQVRVQRLARGVALSGEVASAEAADRALRLATASLPDGLLVESSLNVELHLLPLRALLAGEPGLYRVEVRRVGRGVALTGEVGSADAAERARRLAVASLPENVPVENNLHVALDVEPLRELLAREPGLDRVHVERLARGVALSGDVDSPESADRALRLAAASLPAGAAVENNLRVVFDVEPLRDVLAAEPGLERVQVQRLARGIALRGDVNSPEAADLALRLASASLPEGLLVENNLNVGLELEPIRALMADEPGLGNVRVQRIGRGVALTGEVASAEVSDRAHRLAIASLPENVPLENYLWVVDLEPLRALMAREAGLQGARVESLARGITLVGEVASQAAVNRTLDLAAASLPEGMPVENGLRVVDLEPLRELIAMESGLQGVRVEGLARGVTLAGEVASQAAVERALDLAAASLPEGMPVENGLRVVDLEPLRELIAMESGLQGVHVAGLAGGVTLAGEVASPALLERALDLATASLPDGMPVESGLRVVDLEPLRTLMAAEAGLEGVRAEGLASGVTLAGEVASQAAVERALDLAAASLPEGMPVENGLRVVDLEPLRELIAMESGLQGVHVAGLAGGVTLAGEVASPALLERALDLATASLPDGMPVESGLRVVDLEPLRTLMAAEAGLQGVHVAGLASGVTLMGEVASQAAAERALDLAAASLPEGMPVANDLRVVDLEPLRDLMAVESGLGRVHVQGLAHSVSLSGDVDSPEVADRALRLAAASLPEGIPVDDNLNVGLGLASIRAVLSGEAGLEGVRVRRVGRGVTLTGQVASSDAAERAHRLAVTSLPEGTPVGNNLRVVFDIEPLHIVLAAEPGLERVQVQRLVRGVALSGDVDSPETADRALRLAAASLPDGLLVENNLDVEPDLLPLRTLLAGEPGLEGVEVRKVGRGIALTGQVASAEAANRAGRLAAASLPETVPVENNLRVVFDIEPLRVVLSEDSGLQGVRVQKLARGVALTGDVASPTAAERALGLAIASLPEGLLVKVNLAVGLDLSPLRALLAGEPGLEGVEVRKVGRGIALTGEVASAEAADRAYRLGAASLPAGVTVENNLRVVFDIEPLRTVLAAEPGLERVQVQRLARGVALAGDVDSHAAAERALRLAAASLPEGLLVENNLNVGLDLEPMRALMADEPGLGNVQVQRIGRGVTLTGEVASAEAADRAHRLAVASLPETVPVESNLRVVFDIEPLRALLSGEPGLHLVHVQKLARGVALTGEVASPVAADMALRLAAASLPEGAVVENNLDVGLDLRPARALMAGDVAFAAVRVQRVGAGVALTGEVASADASDRAYRLAVASLPEGMPVENNLRVVADLEPLRELIAGEPGLHGVRVQRLARGVALSGEVASKEAADRALRLANASLPAGVLVENNLNVGLDLEPLRAALAGEPGLHRVQARRLARGVALTGEVDSPEMADRAFRVATASLPEGVLVENNLNLQFDLSPLRAFMAGEPGLEGVEVQRDGRGVALAGEVASMEAADRVHRLAAVSLPEGAPVENHLRVVFDIEPLRTVLAEEPGLGRVHVQRLARSIVISGDVDSPEAENRALRLAAASLPEGVPIDNELRVGPGLGSLRALLAGEPGLAGVEVRRVGRGVALSGEVASLGASDRAYRFAVTSLPEDLPVENSVRVVFDIDPLRALLADEAGLDRVTVQRLARGVALRGDVDSQEAADHALRLAIASLPEGLLIEDNLDVGLDLAPTRALLTDKPGLAGVLVQRVGRGVALTGEVASADAADRAHRLAVASLPESVPVENNLRVLFDIELLRAVLAADPGLERVQVRRLARGVALSGNVDSHAAANRALGLTAASLPEGLLVENNLSVGLDLRPARALLSGEPGLAGVRLQRVGRGVALTGEVPSAEAADRAHRLAAASLPEGVPVESNLRVLFDIEPLRALLAVKPGLDRVEVQRLARGVALSGNVDSPEAAERAVELAAASLPAGLLVENHLGVVLDLAPLRALMAGESGLEGIVVKRIGRGVALTGEVPSAEAADRAHRLAAASLPESLPVENNLRVVLDIQPLRAVLAGEPELAGVRVQRLGGGVVLTGEVASAEAADRARRIASASLPESVPVESSLRVVLDVEALREALAVEPGLDRVQVKRLARGVALSGDVDSPVAEDRALRLAAASLPEGVPVENNLNVRLDLGPLGSVVAGDPDLAGVRVERTGRGVALIGEVGSAEASEQAARLATALLPEGVPVENGLRVVLDIGPLRALLAGAPELGRVEVQKLARGVALTGDVDSHAAADLALRLATASLPEGMLVESSLHVRLDLAPLRVLMAGEPELRNVRVKRVGRGIALTGEVGSADVSERAARLAAASLPEGVAVENNLRVAPDVEPLRVLLAGEPGLERVHVQKLVRGVALAGPVASPEAADRALRLAAASLPEGMLVEDNLTVGLDLAPLRALMAVEAGFEAILVKQVARGVALTGEVGSQTAAERAARLAAAMLPEGSLVENNLRMVLDTGPLRAALGSDPEFDRVHVRDLAHGVSLAGEVSSAAAAGRAQRLAMVSLPPDTKVGNELRIAGPLQVNLEVQIAEVQRSIAEDFGFNWELFGRSAEGDLGGGFRIGQPLPLPAAVGGVGGPGTIPSSVVDGLTSPSFILSQTWEEIGITGMVDALAKAGLANVLARPNVTANSGETASFFSGGEFPLPSGFKDGVIVFEYKKYGVVLDFVPTIVDEGRIELTVRPEVSEPSRDNSVQVTQGIDVPVINVRRAETTVAMGDGESIVIAGLFSSTSNEVQSGVPLLKDLPLVGGMFGHTSTRADELELIVTVTARLVQAGPAPDEALAAGFGQAVNGYYY